MSKLLSIVKDLFLFFLGPVHNNYLDGAGLARSSGDGDVVSSTTTSKGTFLGVLLATATSAATTSLRSYSRIGIVTLGQPLVPYPEIFNRCALTLE